MRKKGPAEELIESGRDAARPDDVGRIGLRRDAPRLLKGAVLSDRARVRELKRAVRQLHGTDMSAGGALLAANQGAACELVEREPHGAPVAAILARPPRPAHGRGRWLGLGGDR